MSVHSEEKDSSIQESTEITLGSDGKPIYNEKGKVMKGPNYFKPNISKILNS